MKLRSLKYLTVEGLKNVWVNRLMSIASIGVLVACMLLMGTAILISSNMTKALDSLQDQNVAMVYFENEATSEQTKTAFEKIKKLSNVKEAIFISKNEGMKSLLDDVGTQYADLFKVLEEDGSFLPDGVRVSFDNLELYDQTIVQIKAIDNVKTINDSRELTMKIVGIRKMINTAGVWIIGLLLITALVIIANTIKITMHNRKLEISIMKAVGATNNFIRIPFVIEGMVLGLLSAGVTMIPLHLAYKMCMKGFSDIMPMSPVPFGSVAWWMFGLFCLIGIAAGCIGSVISIGKYLRREGSEFRAF